MKNIIISPWIILISYPVTASTFVSTFDSIFSPVADTVVYSYSPTDSTIFAPIHCNSISEFFGSCRNPGTTDQGSIAEKDWDNFNKFKNRFNNYKRKKEDFMHKFNKIPESHALESIYKQFESFYAMLHTINNIDKEFIQNNFKKNSVEELFTETVVSLGSLLNHNANQHVESLISGYFKKFPVLFRSIEFDYWYKSYWPGYSDKWGGVGPNLYEDRIKSFTDSGYLSQYVEKTNENDYDYVQIEKEFYAKWNNWNSSPNSETKIKKVYYKFKYKDHPELISKYLNIMNNHDKILIIKEKINKRETIDAIKSKIIEFPSVIFKTLLAMEIAEDAEHNKEALKKNQNKIDTLFIDSLPKITKIISNSSDRCLSYINVEDNVNDTDSIKRISKVSKVRENKIATINSCNLKDLSQEFIIFPIDSGSSEFMISSAKDKGQCLKPAKFQNYFELTPCNLNDKNQKWFFEKNNNANLIKNYNISNNISNNHMNELYQYFDDNYEFDLGHDLQWTTPTSSKNNSYLRSLALGDLGYRQSEWYSGENIKKDLPNILYSYLFIQKYSLPLLPKAKIFIKKVISSKWFYTLQPEVQNFIKSLPNLISLPNISDINKIFNAFKTGEFKIGDRNHSTNPKDIYFYPDKSNENKLNLFVRNFNVNTAEENILQPVEAKSNKYFIYIGSIDKKQNKLEVMNIFNLIRRIKILNLEYKFLSLVNPNAKNKINNIINELKINQHTLKNSLKLAEVKIHRGINNYSGVLGTLTTPIVRLINKPIPPKMPLVYASSEDSGFSYLTDFEYMDMNQINPPLLTDPSNLGSSVPTNTSHLSSDNEDENGYLRMFDEDREVNNEYLLERLRDFDEYEDLDSMEYLDQLHDYGDGMNEYLFEFEAAANAGEEANEALNLVDSSSIPVSSSTVAIGGASVATLLSIISIL